MAKNEWSMAQLTAKAEAYCAAAEHCMSEMRSKLQQWEATEEQCDEIIAHLVQASYIDEQIYTPSICHPRLLHKPSKILTRQSIRRHLSVSSLLKNARSNPQILLHAKNYSVFACNEDSLTKKLVNTYKPPII